MDAFTFPRRGLGGRTTVTVPAPDSSDYHDILDASVTRKHVPLNDTAPTTTAANRGATAGNGTYVNVAGIRYSLGSLVAGDPSSMRGIALSGATTDPPHITIANLVTGKSWTIDIAIQPDKHATKMIVATIGLSQAVAGGVSVEIEDDGASGLRARCWTSIGGLARVLTTGAGSVPIGSGSKLTYQQEEGVGRRIYVDGVQLASDTTFTAFEDTPAGTWYIGAWSDGAAPFDGMMAELASWNTAVGAATIAALGIRAQNALELSLIPAQDFAASSAGTLDILSLDVANPEVNWTVQVVSAGLNASLTGFTANGQGVNWTTGSAGSASPTIRLTRDGGASVSTTRTVSITVTGTPPPSEGFSCIEDGGGTLVDLGNSDNRETEVHLNQGGNARYDASGIIHRVLWAGAVGCGSGLHETTNQFFYRWLGSTQNGGCISGGAIYGNLTKDDDYDGGGAEHRLYPCSDGGHFFLRDRSIRNFTIEGFRFHGCWDPIRLGGTGGSLPNVNPLIENITIKGCWATVIRDDFIENDTMREGLVVEDCLCGDIISKNNGIFHFISHRNTNTAASANTTHRVTVVRDCLVWSMLVKATGRTNAINGYVVQQPFKTVSNGARFDVFDSVFMFDHISIAGDPLINLKNPTSLPKLRNSSGNIVIWRDVGNLGAYPYSLPPGFTLMTGSAGANFWNNRVNQWKAAHPDVRRFNKTGIARPYGGTTSIVDVG